MHTVRRLLVVEYPKYRTHLKALDEDSKLLRFGYRVSDEVIDRLCDNIEADTLHHILFCIENDRLEIIAVGHVATQGEMELAFSVFQEYRGQGMGNKLMKRCIQYCRTHGILKGCMVCLANNSVIKHLCIKNDIKIHTDHGETLANISLPTPTPATFIDEATSVNLGAIDYISKRVTKPWALLGN